MNFYKALSKTLEGEKITRLEWDDKGCYGFMMNGVLMIRVEFKYHQWVLCESDVLATDWIVI